MCVALPFRMQNTKTDIFELNKDYVDGLVVGIATARSSQEGTRGYYADDRAAGIVLMYAGGLTVSIAAMRHLLGAHDKELCRRHRVNLCRQSGRRPSA